MFKTAISTMKMMMGSMCMMPWFDMPFIMCFSDQYSGPVMRL